MENNLLSVEAMSEMKVMPDTAMIEIVVQVSKKTAKEAQKEASDIVKKLHETLETLNVEREDVTTRHFETTPIIDYSQKKFSKQITGYKTVHSFQVKTNRLDDLGLIVDNLVDEHVRIQTIHYELSDETKEKNKAITIAIDKAKEKANLIAEQLGIRIVGVHKVNVNDSSHAPFGHVKMRAMNDLSLEEMSAEQTIIKPKELVIHAQASLTFLIQN